MQNHHSSVIVRNSTSLKEMFPNFLSTYFPRRRKTYIQSVSSHQIRTYTILYLGYCLPNIVTQMSPKRYFANLDIVSVHILNHQQMFTSRIHPVMVSKRIYYIKVLKFPTETYFNEIRTFDCYLVTGYNDAFSNIIRGTPSYFHTATANIINSQVGRC